MSTGSVSDMTADTVAQGFGWPVIRGSGSPSPQGWQGLMEDQSGLAAAPNQPDEAEPIEEPIPVAPVSRETPPAVPLVTGHSLTVSLPRETPTDQAVDATEPSTAITSAAVATDTQPRSDPGRPKLPPLPHPPAPRIITIANQKGGVGKTTTAVNLAAALSLSGLSVLVIDQDPQGNASTALGVEHHEGEAGIYEVLVESRPLAEVVHACPDIPNLWVVPATIDLAGAEIELVPMVARETRLRGALRAYLDYRERAGLPPLDYVFVDCPPSLGLLTVNALAAAGEVLVPIQCEYYALEGVQLLLRNIDLIRTHLNPDLHVSTMLLTMFDGRTRLAADVVEEVRAHFPQQVLATLVPRSVRISEAPSNGQTVLTYDPNSSGSLSYLAAATELANRALVTA